MLPNGFLALPATGETTATSLFRKLRLRVLGSLLQPGEPGLSRTMLAALPRVQQVISTMARTHKRALLDALASPDIIATTLSYEAGLLERQRPLGVAIPALLTRLGPALAEMVLWDVPITHLLGHRFDPAVQGVLVGKGVCEVRHADDRTETVTSRHAMITDTIELAALDTNPLAYIEAHPDKQGNALDLGDHSTDDWCTSLRDALNLIETALPALRAELDTSLLRIVPVGFEPQKHLSASYREAPGLIYMTLHPSPLTMAEALIHETQHGKLNALSWFDPVLHNAQTEWTSSPVRPDLRPLMGVLLAAHAFVPVAALHARLAELDHPIANAPRFGVRRDEVIEANRRSLATLADKANPTATGERVVAALNELHAAVTA